MSTDIPQAEFDPSTLNEAHFLAWVKQFTRAFDLTSDIADRALLAERAHKSPYFSGLTPVLRAKIQRLIAAQVPLHRGPSGLSQEVVTYVSGTRPRLLRAAETPEPEPVAHVGGFSRGRSVWGTDTSPVDRVAGRVAGPQSRAK